MWCVAEYAVGLVFAEAQSLTAYSLWELHVSMAEIRIVYKLLTKKPEDMTWFGRPRLQCRNLKNVIKTRCETVTGLRWLF